MWTAKTHGNDFLNQSRPCVALDAPAMAAVMAAAVATLLTVEALPTQHAAALPTAAPAQAAVQQTNVLEAVHPAARSLAAPPSMITIIVWRIITGPTFLHLLNLTRQISRSLSESYKARAAHARAHMC